jgi:hypothetical protein
MIVPFNETTQFLRGIVNTTSSKETESIIIGSILGSILLLICCWCILCSCKKAC